MDNVRPLTLIDCFVVPFTLALDPEQTLSDFVLYCSVEELILYTRCSWYPFDVDLSEMAKNRASRGAKLSLVKFVDIGGRWRREDVFRLKEYVIHVEYRTDGTTPNWDDVPGANRDGSE